MDEPLKMAPKDRNMQSLINIELFVLNVVALDGLLSQNPYAIFSNFHWLILPYVNIVFSTLILHHNLYFRLAWEIKYEVNLKWIIKQWFYTPKSLNS
jgi:hypothetical protein